MEHVSKVSLRIANFDSGSDYEIKNYAIDFAMMCKNIKETSAGESDKVIRMKELSERSGIDLMHIKKLTE